MGKPGRPTKLTQEVFDKIVQWTVAGNYVHVSASLSGVQRDSFYRWLRTGAADKSAGKNTIYARFSDAIEAAEAKSEAAEVLNIKGAGKRGDWRASVTYLSKRFPDRWGDKTKVELDVADGLAGFLALGFAKDASIAGAGEGAAEALAGGPSHLLAGRVRGEGLEPAEGGTPEPGDE